MSDDDLGTQLRKALLAIGKDYDATLEPVRRAPGSHVKTSREPPLPISAHILDVRAMCRSRLKVWWTYVVAGRDLHTEHLTRDDVAGMCDMLIRHSDWLGNTTTTQKALADLEQSARDLGNIAAPRRREWMPLGTCPLVFEIEGSEDGDTFTIPVPCTGTVRAYPDCDPYCDACRTEAVVTWWEAKMQPQLSRLVPASELVDVVHSQFGRVVTEATVRKWVERGIIAKADTDCRGRSMYDRGSVAYALARWRVVA